MPADDGGRERPRCERRYDFQLDNRVSLPLAVIEKVGELIVRNDVHSVSCPFDDSRLWWILVGEQVRRATRLDLPLQEAFTLSGPDGGLWDTPIEEWGGYVHIPYEGMCGADLVLFPKWRNFFPENAAHTGRLSTATRCCCHYLLSPRDFGELSFATRLRVGDWSLYQSRESYVPCERMKGP
jgi:hypothetical protein